MTCATFTGDFVLNGIELRVSVQVIFRTDISCDAVVTSTIVGKSMCTLTHFVISETLI